jgi:flagellin
VGLRINQNIAALNAYRHLSVSEGDMNKSLEKLSSGFRINRAADDAAGLVVSEKLRSQVNGLKVAVRNTQDGVSVVQTAEGALTEVHSILQRMRDLAVQASNTGAGTSGASAAQLEVSQLSSELDRIASSTTFAGKALLDGSYTGTFQVGSGTATTDQIAITINSGTATKGVNATDLGLGTVNVSTNASGAITAIDSAIDKVSTLRGTLGAYQNRFEHTIANLQVAQENLAASESRIRDTDMASEMMNFTRAQILQQAGTAMLAQANSAPQSVLQLLRG